MTLQPIYVERFIKAPFERIWEYTQDPSKHQHWDLRFSEIVYLPKPSPKSPQQFLYTTRIGFGLKISGKGESVATRHSKNDESVSVLKFWSDDRKSLIRTGSGYWKYVPQTQGVRFLTLYDYKTRFGLLGRFLDFFFRPLLNWATALSFDCLAFWLEKGIHPKISFERFLIQWIVRWSLALIWFYQGLIPKILFRDTGELEILRGSGFFYGHEEKVLWLVGLAEILFGFFFLFFKKSKKIYYIHIFILLALLLGAQHSQPALFISPFNPITLTLGMAALSIVGLKMMGDLPSAKNCLRKQRK